VQPSGILPEGFFVFKKRRSHMQRYRIVALLFIVMVFGCVGPLSAAEQEAVELENVVVTATRDSEKERQVPYNVSVITGEDIQQSNAQDAADLLRTVPGVTVANNTANPKGSSVDIRGFGEAGSLNTLVLVDGRRVNQIDISSTDWSQIPLDQIERIEVIRGGGSVLYGDNAVGGVVNIITKKGQGKPSVQAEALGGSYGLNIQRVSSQGAVDDFRYTVHARHENTAGFRDNGNYDGQDYGGSVGYDIGDLIKLDVSGNYHYDKYGLPGALSYQDLHTWADRDDTKTPDDHGWTEDYFIRLSSELDLKEWGRFITDFSYRNRSSEAKFHYVDTVFFLPGRTQTKYAIPNFGVNPKWIWEKGLWRFHNKLIAGFDYYYTDSKLNSHDPHPIFGGDPTRGFLSQTANIERQTWALYFHDDFSVLKNLIFSFGYRHEEIENNFRGASYFFTWTSFADTSNYFLNAWEVGLTYLFLDNSKVYGRISPVYRYPAIDEYFSVYSGLNPFLKPQTGITYEVGVDHYFTKAMRSQLTFFWTELDNEIYYNPLTYTNANYDRTNHWGIEFSAEAKPWEWLKIWANYTYTEAKIMGGVYKGNDVPDVPPHKVNFGIGVTPLEGLAIDIWANYVGARRFISDQPNVVPKLGDYITVNAKVSYTWRFITAFVGVNNIFNEEYSEYGVCNPATRARNYYPSPGVNFLGGLSAKF
jgi:iron complex outermembrane receptor protein